MIDDIVDRPNVFEIDLGAVASCTWEIRRLIGPDRYFCATLKAGGYGYGVLPVARTVLAHGADGLSLASLRDAVTLRRAGIEVPILVYAGALADRDSVALHQAWRLVPSLHNEVSLEAFEAHASAPMPVAVKIDVGPERIGVPYTQALEFIERVHASAKLQLFAIHAHPNIRGGEGTAECMAWQHDRLLRLRTQLQERGIAVPRTIIASSKMLRIGGEAMALDAVDPGAALFSSLAGGPAQAFHSLRTRLLSTRTVERTEHMQQAPFEMRPGMRIGVLPIGYSDGMHRLHAGHVLIQGRKAPVVGKPALEYTRIDLSDVPQARVGDEVVIIGRQGDACISPEQACAHQRADRVIDLALQVGPAVQRVYLNPRVPLSDGRDDS